MRIDAVLLALVTVAASNGCSETHQARGAHVDDAPIAGDGAGPVLDSGSGGADAASQDASAPDGGDAAVSCLPDPGVGCSYVPTPGTVTITKLEPADASLNNCATDPMVVTFTFAPADAARSACFASGSAADDAHTFTLSGGKNPPRSCLDQFALAVGDTLPATRRDLSTGTCTPLIFELKAQLVMACESACR